MAPCDQGLSALQTLNFMSRANAGNGSISRSEARARRSGIGASRPVPRVPRRPVTEPTAGAQPWPAERFLMPHTRRSQSPSGMAQSGGNRIFRYEYENTFNASHY